MPLTIHLPLSLSLSQTLSSFQVKSRHTLGQKRMFTLLNNAGSPQFLHLSSLFVFFFRPFETPDLLQHTNRE